MREPSMMRLSRSTWTPSPTFRESRPDSDEGHHGDQSLRLPGSWVQSEVRSSGDGMGWASGYFRKYPPKKPVDSHCFAWWVGFPW